MKVLKALSTRPRSGRPPKVACALERHLQGPRQRDPLQHGSCYAQWSCRELATVLAHQTGSQLGRESVRRVSPSQPLLSVEAGHLTR